MSNAPYLAPFSTEKSITLRPMPNGGWVVEQPGGLGEMPTPLGAFSNSLGMIEALNRALNGWRYEKYKGSKQRHDWNACISFIDSRLSSGDIPETQEEFISEILEWFKDKYDLVPDHSSIRKKLSPIWRHHHQSK